MEILSFYINLGNDSIFVPPPQDIFVLFEFVGLLVLQLVTFKRVFPITQI